MIKKGTLVCKSQPFVYAVTSKCHGKYCDFCLKRNDSLYKCSQCAFMSYCDRNCQKNAWKVHKHECLNIKFLPADKTMSESELLISRVIYKLKFGGSEEQETVGNVTRRFKDLESHSEDIKNDAERLASLKQIAESVKDLLPAEDLPPYSEIVEIFGKCQINGDYITNDEDSIIGIAVYLGTSFFNHSCLPNAVEVSEGIAKCIYLIEDIPVLDYSKIFVSYYNPQNPTEERRNELQKVYYFDCNCAKCLDVNADQLLHCMKCENPNCYAPVPVKNDSLSCDQCGQKISTEWKNSAITAMELCKTKLPTLRTYLMYNAAQFTLNQCEDVLDSISSILHRENIYFYKTVDLTFDAYVKWKPHPRVFQLADYLILFLKKSGNSSIYCPRIGMSLLKVATFAEILENPANARRYLDEAFAILDVTHGVSEQGLILYREMLKKLDATSNP